MRRLVAPVVGVALLAPLAGCGLLVGVDWDRVATQDSGTVYYLPDGAPAPPGYVPPDTDGGSPNDGSVVGRDGNTGTDTGGPIQCSAPKVKCISGCCDDNLDPGLPSGISAGQGNSCAVTTTGKVRCWGSNIVGQLGRGKGDDSPVPVTAYNMPSGATASAIGMAHGCAVVGQLIGCWGANGSGQVGFDGSPASLGLEAPGRVQVIQGTSLAVSVGSSFSCAAVDGTAYCWGANDYGQLAADLSIYQSSKPLTVGQIGSGILGVGAGGTQACAIVAGGGVSCWGGNGGKPPTAIATISGASMIAVAPFHACAVTGGAVQCWGSNLSGELGNNSLGGNTPTSPTGVPAGVTAITANGSHTCAIAAGQVWCWGQNVSGELGRDTGGGSGAPAPVQNVAGPVAVAAGNDHTCALLANNKVKCWGRNAEGQLGNGTLDTGFNPVEVKWPGGS